MGEPIIRVNSVVINVVDYEAQKAFWTAVLGTGVRQEFAPFFGWLAPQHEGGVQVALQAVEDPTPGRRRLHIDAVVDDVEAAHRPHRRAGRRPRRGPRARRPRLAGDDRPRGQRVLHRLGVGPRPA
jgi:catechol 2,3-dioxygenase-like lactoylglutathione lyase family enzyme